MSIALERIESFELMDCINANAKSDLCRVTLKSWLMEVSF